MDTNKYPEDTSALGSDLTPDENASAPEHAAGNAAAEGATESGGQDIGAVTVAAPSTAGGLLSAARLHSGLSIGEVANHLKLSIRQVESLEADAYDRLPSPMFVRGFAKSYARLVQIDPAPVLAALESRLPTDSLGAIASRMAANQPLPRSPIPFPSTDQPSRRLHSVAALLAAIVVGFLAFEWLGPKLQSSEPEAVAPAATVVPPGGPAAGAGTEAVVLPAEQPSTVPEGDPSRPAGAPAAPAPAGAAEVGSALAPQGGAAPAAVAATERTVRLAFDREAWVEVRDARGKLIFSQLNPPGSSQVVQGEAPLSLVVGNARSVRVAYQDKDIDLAPFTRVDVARLTLE